MMYTNHVFALVGKSGSGKTSIQYAMRHTFSIPRGVTTRPKRPGDIIGQYIHTDIDMFCNMIKDMKLICVNHAYDNLYAYLLQDFNDLHSIVVVDVVGLRQMQELFGFENVTGIYVEAPDDVREQRTESRKNYNAKTRALADERKFKNAYHLCDYKITNDGNLIDAINEFKSIAKEVLKENGYV